MIHGRGLMKYPLILHRVIFSCALAIFALGADVTACSVEEEIEDNDLA
jgi:hypothetical protein